MRARDRVKVSWLLITWMATALLVLVVNWLSAASLSAIKHSTVGEALLQIVSALVQYFTCSLVSMRLDGEAEGEVDMPAFFARQRRPILLAFVALGVVAVSTNYLDRATSGLEAGAWIQENLQIIGLEVTLAAALVFRAPRRPQCSRFVPQSVV